MHTWLVIKKAYLHIHNATFPTGSEEHTPTHSMKDDVFKQLDFLLYIVHGTFLDDVTKNRSVPSWHT